MCVCVNSAYFTYFCFRLLDVLAGRKEPKDVLGDVLLDGSPPPDNFKCMVGYVVQVSCGVLYLPVCLYPLKVQARCPWYIPQLSDFLCRTVIKFVIENNVCVCVRTPLIAFLLFHIISKWYFVTPMILFIFV